MVVKPIQIRRGIWMYRVEVPVDNATIPPDQYGRELNSDAKKWLEDRGFDLDRYSNAWTYYTYGNSDTADFFFADPQVATLFKLTFG